MSCPECGVLYCPDCGGVLVALKEELANKKKVTISYCFSCGGYWCDHWVANDISYEDFLLMSKKLPVFDKSTTYGGSGRCPHCFVPLDTLRSESIPANLIVKYCPQCRGNWFPQGEFTRFKIAQKSKLDYLKTWNIPLTSIYQVLLPVLVLFVIGASIPATLYLTQRSTEDRTMASSYVNSVKLMSLSDGSILVSFFTSEPLASEIEYGQGMLDKKKETISVEPQNFHQITLKNLEDKKTYHYRIILHKDGRVVTLPDRTFTAE